MGALHVVFGHIVFGGFFQSQAQARVGAGIAAAHAGCNGDFFNQTGKDFAAFGILTGFFYAGYSPTCYDLPYMDSFRFSALSGGLLLIFKGRILT